MDSAFDGSVRLRVHLPADLPFDKKWDVLKPVIKQLYIDDDLKLSEVIHIIQTEYDFNGQ